MVEKYYTKEFGVVYDVINGVPLFTTKQRALTWGKKNGLNSYHIHYTYNGKKGYMPGTTLDDAVKGVTGQSGICFCKKGSHGTLYVIMNCSPSWPVCCEAAFPDDDATGSISFNDPQEVPRIITDEFTSESLTHINGIPVFDSMRGALVYGELYNKIVFKKDVLKGAHEHNVSNRKGYMAGSNHSAAEKAIVNGIFEDTPLETPIPTTTSTTTTTTGSRGGGY